MEKGKQTILQGALILTASTMVVKVIGALFKIPLANILGGVGMSYFVSAYDVLIPIYSMTVTGLGVAVSRMVSEYGGRGEEVGNILKTARLMFLGIGTLAAVLLFIGAGPLTKLIGNPAAALSVCCIAPSVLFSCLSSAYRGYFQGRQNMLPTARSQVVEAMVKLVAGILFLFQAERRGNGGNTVLAWYNAGGTAEDFAVLSGWSCAGRITEHIVWIIVYSWSVPTKCTGTRRAFFQYGCQKAVACCAANCTDFSLCQSYHCYRSFLCNELPEKRCGAGE